MLVFQLIDLEMAEAGLERLYLERTVFKEAVWVEEADVQWGDFDVLGEDVERVGDPGEMMEALYFEMLDLEVEMRELQGMVEEMSPYDELMGGAGNVVEGDWLAVEWEGGLVEECARALAGAAEERRIWKELLGMARDLRAMEGRMSVMKAAVKGRSGLAGEWCSGCVSRKI